MIYGLQTAIYGRLTGLISVEVFDHVPQETQSPFVVIGDIINNENDTDSELGFNAVATITTYAGIDTARGYETVSNIMLEVYGALHYYNSLVVGGYGISAISQEFSEVLRDNDGITRLGVQRFRVFYEKI